MKIRSPRKGTKPKKQYRRKFKDSQALWVGIRMNHRWRTRDESAKFIVSDWSGKTSYAASVQSASKILSKPGDFEPNGKIPSIPGIFWKKNGWALVDYLDFTPAIVMIHTDLNEALEHFEEHLRYEHPNFLDASL